MFGHHFLFLFSKSGIYTVFKFWIQILFSPGFNPFFLFGDFFQQRVFIYNYHLFHSLHIYFIPSISHSNYWTRESHDNHNIEGVSTRENHPSISKTGFSYKPISPSISKNPTGTNLERRSRHGVVERQSRSGVVTGGGVLGSAISGTFLALSSLGFMLAGFWINGVRWFLVDFGLWGDWLEVIFGWFWIGGD